HDTLRSTGGKSPERRTGAGCVDQRDPSHAITLGWVPIAPTATHTHREAQETSSSPVTPFGTAWIDHRLPLRRSMTGNDSITRLPVRCPPLTEPPPPTVQAFPDVHETLQRPPLVVPAGVGTACLDHSWPFQRSTSG